MLQSNTEAATHSFWFGISLSLDVGFILLYKISYLLISLYLEWLNGRAPYCGEKGLCSILGKRDSFFMFSYLSSFLRFEWEEI